MTLNSINPDHSLIPDEPSEDESSGAEEGSYDIMSYGDEQEEEEEEEGKSVSEDEEEEDRFGVSGSRNY